MITELEYTETTGDVYFAKHRQVIDHDSHIPQNYEGYEFISIEGEDEEQLRSYED